MILALMGLHGSGKSHLAATIEAMFGWKVYVKRDLFKILYTQEGDASKNWVDWYRGLYMDIGPYETMNKILDLIPKYQSPIILDSIHNFAEWKSLRNIYPNNSILAAVAAPKSVRSTRNEPKDVELDLQRIDFWHHRSVNNDHISCLFSEAEWVFNGCVSTEMVMLEFQNFLNYLASR